MTISGRKRKYNVEKIVEIVQKVTDGQMSVAECSKCYHVENSTIRGWMREYEMYGASAFRKRTRNNSYSKEFKEVAIQEVLRGEGSMRSIALKYGIRSIGTLRNWVVKYDRLEVIDDYDPKGEVYMSKPRKTLLEERLEIVRYCLENNRDYKGAASKYGVSYAQVYNWVKKYNLSGELGLGDGRGRRKQESELTELEKLQRENEVLKRKLQEKEMEATLLKKLKEIERRGYSRGSSKKQNT
ncbi:transposase [Erysipelothrix sp. HDW6A]|uniref:helix-turn-helix domain-containing protein n=1 Tax=Erysipelothrix sp. HDW6A TaxID=2714928 RepID=UPI00140CDC2C|nr:helix-turn-helix domain-containing protein [Erysipelothrix sp. HDW6A]QIK57055.1 transposase [Erysipelothrix sp. HDW6A]